VHADDERALGRAAEIEIVNRAVEVKPP